MGGSDADDPRALDPADPACEAALVRLLDSPQAVAKELLPLVRTCAADGSSERLKAHASIVLGFHAYGAQRPEEGSRLYRHGLRVLWGSDTAAERNACVNLASACAYQGRLLESLVLSRRGCELSRRAGQRIGLFVASMALLRTLAALGDWERFNALRKETEELLALHGNAEHRFQFDTVIVDAALIREDAEEAARALESAERAPLPIAEPRHFSLAWAHIELQRGEPVKALERARAARAGETVHDQMDERLHAVEITAAAGCGEPGAAAEAHAFLDRLTGPLHAVLPPGRRMRIATRLAREVGERVGDLELAARAYEVAGAAALERMGELETFRIEFPEVQVLADEDALLLDEYRERFLEEHGGILEAVRRLFRGEPEAVRVFSKARPGEDPVLRACAWCGKVRGPEGVWVDLGTANVPRAPISGRVEVSHGVCLPCESQMLGLDQTG